MLRSARGPRPDQRSRGRRNGVDDEVLRRIAEARERGPAFAGQPVGWVVLTPSEDTSRTVYVQSSAIGWVQDNA